MGSIKKTLLTLIALTVLCGSAMAVDVEITSDPARTTVDKIANIYVLVLDNSTPQNNTLVNFTTDLGNLSVASAYTNSSGIATVWINSTAAGNATINASVGSIFNTTNVIYLAGKPVSIDIDVTQDQLVVGNTTIVNLIPYDKYNNVNSTVNLTINITIPDIRGEILHQVNITRAPFTLTNLVVNKSTATLVNSTHGSSNVLLSINSTLAGNITLTANAENITSTTNITFTPEGINSFSVQYNNECTVNETSEIIVSVLDKYDNPVKGAVVIFNATPPPDTKYNSPVEYYSHNLTPKINITNQEGLASTIFRADKRSGDNTINISVGGLNLIISIQGIAGIPNNILFTHTPATVYANNIDTYTLKAQVVDQFFNPVLQGGGALTKKIRFNTLLGSTILPLNESGCVTTLVGPAPHIITATITATYENETGLTNITNNTYLSFVLGSLNRIINYANPDTVLTANLTGNHDSIITIIAIDEWGHPIPGINVMLNNTNTTLGNLTVEGINATNLINATTDSNGKIQGVFTSKNITGNATITAMNGSINASTTVEVKDQPFLSVFITTEPISINSGDIVNVTTIISVEGELPITRPAARSMLVLDRSGSMDPDYYAGTPLDVVLVLDRSGSMEFLGSNPEQPMTDSKTAAKIFMDNLVSNSQVGVVSFASSSRDDIGLRLLNSSDNKTLVRNVINGITATGGTAMGDGMADANTMLVNGRANTSKIMVVLTDGVSHDGSDCDGSNATAFANANDITIYTIGLGSAEYIDESVLQRIASETGGRYYNAPTSSELRNVYNSIAQEISDYDITKINYGDEGFTSYNYEKTDSIDAVKYVLRFDGYDFDATFDAGSNYGGASAGECLIRVNGQNYTLIPSPLGTNNEWVNDYEYDITRYVQNGSNAVTFYDYHEYLGLGAYTSEVRNVDILENDVVIASYSTDTDLNGSGYNCLFDGNETTMFEDTFFINETINDLKVQLDWENTTADMDLTLTSPDGHVYGAGGDTTGYYFDDREAVQIDIRSPDFDTYISSTYPNTNYTDEISFYVTSDLNDAGDQASSILRWKLPDMPTHNAKIESVRMSLHGMEEPSPGWDSNNTSRSINVYDITTSYTYPNWNNSNSSNPWANGSFSSSDYNNYLIDSVPLRSSINDTVVEFDITNATWNSNRVPDWGEECNIVLVGNNYNGTDADKSVDRFASGETNTQSHRYTLNGWQPLITVTYSIQKEVSEYIWIHPLPYTYPDTDMDTTVNGNWTVRVTGSGNGTQQFNITTSIDKKSATKIASHAFISSFDENRGDRLGLALYSNDSVGNSNTQTSYLRNRSTWVGYFEGTTPRKSYMLNFTGYDLDSTHDDGYGECYIEINGDYATSMPPPNSGHEAALDYSVDITDFAQNGSNIISFYDYHHLIEGTSWDNEIKDVEIFENEVSIESYQPTTFVELTATPYNYTFDATVIYTTFNLTWENLTDDLDLYLYKGVDLVDYSNNTTGFEELSVRLDSGYSYHVVVEGENINNETKFNLTVSESLDWQEWYAMTPSTLNDSLAHLNNSIDNMTADGLTAIDEGIYVANNELSTVSGNSTIVLMTDGLDNSGYHSLMLEALRARDNNTVIYTIGFGNNESEVDPVLFEIANITGGEYYFAPNASVLKSIFRGIAANITNFTAEAPTLNLHIPNNYITNLSLATATYVANSSNATTGIAINFTAPTYPNRSNAEPNITTMGNETKTILSWDMPNLNPGEKWGVWYQLKVNGAGYVPLILPSSYIGYTDVNGTNVTEEITYGGGSNLGGSGVNVNYLALSKLQLSANPSIVLVGEPSNIVVSANFVNGDPAIANINLHTNLGYFNNSFQNIFNLSVTGSNVLNPVIFKSSKADYATINAVGKIGNDSVEGSVVVVVRPKGKITIS